MSIKYVSARMASLSPTRLVQETMRRFTSPSPTRTAIADRLASLSPAKSSNFMERLDSILPRKGTNQMVQHSNTRQLYINYDPLPCDNRTTSSVLNAFVRRGGRNCKLGQKSIKPLKKRTCEPRIVEKPPQFVQMQRKSRNREKKCIRFELPRNPECCNEPCSGASPRFDDLYYRPTAMSERQYQQTWHSCKRKTVLKTVCNIEETTPPPLPKRHRTKPRQQTNQNCMMINKSIFPDCENLRGKNCWLVRSKNNKQINNTQCAKITLSGCSLANLSRPCKTARKRPKCKKLCTPTPSFSECNRLAFNPEKPNECFCQALPSMCETWAEKRTRQGMQSSRLMEQF